MEFQDWKEVKWDKRGVRQANETKDQFIRREAMQGRTVSVKKPTNSDTVMSIRKLEAEEDTFKHKTVSMSVSKRIAQKRCEMKMSQKDLAMKLSLPESVIRDYEKHDSKVIPNPAILNKIEKILGKIRD